MADVTNLLIVVFSFVLPLMAMIFFVDHKKNMAKINKDLKTSEAENIKNELAAVKSRLEVLEAIVTDKKYQLSDEINSLKVVK